MPGSNNGSVMSALRNHCQCLVWAYSYVCGHTLGKWGDNSFPVVSAAAPDTHSESPPAYTHHLMHTLNRYQCFGFESFVFGCTIR